MVTGVTHFPTALRQAEKRFVGLFPFFPILFAVRKPVTSVTSVTGMAAFSKPAANLNDILGLFSPLDWASDGRQSRLWIKAR